MRRKIFLYAGLGIFFAAAFFPSMSSSAQEVEDCGDVWAVKSIQVDSAGLVIQFDTGSGGFQIVYKVEAGKVVPLEYGEFFSVEAGETIGWGDGDHASMTLTVLSIGDGLANVVLTQQHMPPGGKAVVNSRTCAVLNTPRGEGGGVAGEENEKE